MRSPPSGILSVIVSSHASQVNLHANRTAVKEQSGAPAAENAAHPNASSHSSVVSGVSSFSSPPSPGRLLASSSVGRLSTRSPPSGILSMSVSSHALQVNLHANRTAVEVQSGAPTAENPAHKSVSSHSSVVVASSFGLVSFSSEHPQSTSSGHNIGTEQSHKAQASVPSLSSHN